MSTLDAVILGLFQGLSEFLPISSSGHLVIAPWLIGFQDPGLSFDVALHLGTLIGVVAYFWRDWWGILQAGLGFKQRAGAPALNVVGAASGTTSGYHDRMMLWYLVLATVPAAVAGLFLKELAETTLRHPLMVATNMVALGWMLLLVDKKHVHSRSFGDINLKIALIIGISQVLALLPGVSRSGITITAALYLGLNRQSAARFSFLLSTPVIFGACLLKAQYITTLLHNPQALLGIGVSALSGFISIKYLIKLVSRYSYAVFSYYRFLFGISVFVVYFSRQ